MYNQSIENYKFGGNGKKNLQLEIDGDLDDIGIKINFSNINDNNNDDGALKQRSGESSVSNGSEQEQDGNNMIGIFEQIHR